MLMSTPSISVQVSINREYEKTEDIDSKQDINMSIVLADVSIEGLQNEINARLGAMDGFEHLSKHNNQWQATIYSYDESTADVVIETDDDLQTEIDEFFPDDEDVTATHAQSLKLRVRFSPTSLCAEPPQTYGDTPNESKKPTENATSMQSIETGDHHNEHICAATSVQAVQANPYVDDTLGCALQQFSPNANQAFVEQHQVRVQQQELKEPGVAADQQEGADPMAAIELTWQDLEIHLTERVKFEEHKSENIQIGQTSHSKQGKMAETIGIHEVISALSRSRAVGVVAASAVIAAMPTLYALPPLKWWKESYRKQHNELVDPFNAKLEQLEKLESALLQNKQKLVEYESELNSTEFLFERANDQLSRVIVCIGITGYGKSVVCNRLIGNASSTQDLEESKEAQFKVADSGQFESETKSLHKQMKRIILTNKPQNTEKASFTLSVVDTPGAFDSDGKDDQYNSQMVEYFKASGGVNMFAIFFRYGLKGDENYKKLLKQYTEFWGKDFWKHCVIIITHCDMASKRLRVSKTKKGIRQFLTTLDVADEIPMYEFGEDNFETSLKQIFLSLIEEGSVYGSKYQCDDIVTPIEQLWKETKQIQHEYNTLANTLNETMEKIKQAKQGGQMWGY